MTPSRWVQINDLFNVVVEQAPAEQQRILNGVRARDPDLVDTVEALLQQTAANWSVFPGREKSGELLATLPGGILQERYRLDRQLGQSGFGVVYLAYDERLHQKPVVVKFLTGVAPRDEWFRKKFGDEIAALARIDHPGVVGILDAGQTPSGNPFIVMQYIEGRTLRSEIESGPMDRERVARIIRQVGQALSAAHSRGVQHRDLKPGNIMVQPSSGGEIVRLIDFGIASIRDAGSASSTQPTRVAGNFAYMAPEQFGGHPSPTSDIFAMAVIATEMLMGRVAVGNMAGSELNEFQQLRPDVSPEAVSIIRKALSVQAAERFQDAGVFGDQLAAALGGASTVLGCDPKTVPTGSLLGGRYMLQREIGRGGFGVVYLAADLQLHDKPVVVKILMTTSTEDSWRYKKFQGEIEALARINHPGIVQVTDAGETPEGRPFMVTEYIEGAPLRFLIRDGGIDFGKAASIVRQIGSALEAAHGCGVWHRDLKPENVLVQNLEESGGLRVKVIDFGIATILHDEKPMETADTRVVGSFRYMAPEQFMGRPEAASDIYGLGVIAYELLTGRKPFDAHGAAELYALQSADDYPKPRVLRPQVSVKAERIVMKALAFHAEDRHRSAREFGNELANALERGTPVPIVAAGEAFPRAPARSTTYDVFVSHASRDLEFAQNLTVELEQRGARCFLAPDDVPSGKLFPQVLTEAIQNARCFVVVLTENTNLSVQVSREVEIADSASKPIVGVKVDGAEPVESLAFFLSHARWVECPYQPTQADYGGVETAVRRHVPAFSGAGMAPRPRPRRTEEPDEPLLTEAGEKFLLGPAGERQVRLIAFFASWALVTAVLSVLANASAISVKLEGPYSPSSLMVRFGYLYELNCALVYLFVIPCFLYFALGFVQEAQAALVNLQGRDQLVVNQPEIRAGYFARLFRKLKTRLRRALKRNEPDTTSQPTLLPSGRPPTALDLIAAAYRRSMSPFKLVVAFLGIFLVIVGTEYLPPKSDYKRLMFGYVQAPWIADYPKECPRCTLLQLSKLGRRIEPLGRLSADQLGAYRIVPPYYHRSGSWLERVAFILFMISALGLEVSFTTFGVWTGLKILFISRLIYRSVAPSKTHYVRLHLWFTDPSGVFGLEPIHRVLMQVIGALGVGVVLEILSWWANILKGSKRALDEDLSTLGGWGQFLVANFTFGFALLLLVYLFFVSGKAREAAREESKRIAAIRRVGGRKASIENVLALIGRQSIWNNSRYTLLYLAAPVVCMLSLLILNRVSIAQAVGGFWESFLRHILGNE
jgi:serine/threonine protein kinase